MLDVSGAPRKISASTDEEGLGTLSNTTYEDKLLVPNAHGCSNRRFRNRPHILDSLAFSLLPLTF